MNDPAPTIKVDDLGKYFGGLVAIERLSFACKRGEIFGFVGPDGAGKTTVMRMLAGIMPPDAGSIVIDGIDVVAAPEAAKQYLSYMPQRFGLYEDLTVDENIAFFADLFEVNRNQREERAKRLLAASGMLPFRTRRAGNLSGGMKQKLGLTCSLIHTPKILFLDEPTAGVDPVSRRDFWRILYDLRREGVTIVIATSYLDEAERCTRLGLLYGGHLLHCGTPNELKQLMPGELLSVTSPRARHARDLVHSLPGVAKVLLVGDGIHVIVDDAADRKPQIVKALAGAGIAATRIEALRPSIEDLFGALLDETTSSS